MGPFLCLTAETAPPRPKDWKLASLYSRVLHWPNIETKVSEPRAGPWPEIAVKDMYQPTRMDSTVCKCTKTYNLPLSQDLGVSSQRALTPRLWPSVAAGPSNTVHIVSALPEMDICPLRSSDGETSCIDFAMWPGDADFVDAFHEWRILDGQSRHASETHDIHAEYTYAGSVVHGIGIYLLNLRIHTRALEILLEAREVPHKSIDCVQHEQESREALWKWEDIEDDGHRPPSEQMKALSEYFDTVEPYITLLERKYIEMGFQALCSNYQEDEPTPKLSPFEAALTHRKMSFGLLAVARQMISDLLEEHDIDRWNTYSLHHVTTMLRSVATSLTVVKLHTNKEEEAFWDIVRTLITLERYLASDASKGETYWCRWASEVRDVHRTLSTISAFGDQHQDNCRAVHVYRCGCEVGKKHVCSPAKSGDEHVSADGSS